jgi:hypothetical protein
VKSKIITVVKYALILLLTLLAGVLIFSYHLAANWDEINEPIYSETSTSIQVPFNTIILVRGEVGLGAFMLKSRVSRYGFLNGVSYEYWLSTTNEFTPANIQKGSGTVYERYQVKSTTSDAETEIEDIGGKYNIIVGGYHIEWSSGNHIYAQTNLNDLLALENTNSFAISATNRNKFSEVDFTDKSLKWLKSK